MKLIYNEFIQAADLIISNLFNAKGHDLALEFRYANLRMPRQCGKSIYLASMANLLSIPTMEAKRNVWFFDGINTSKNERAIPLNDNITFMSLPYKTVKSIDDINMEIFQGKTIDVMLFDEVCPDVVAQILYSDELKPMICANSRFVALGMHSMDFAFKKENKNDI